MSVICNQQEVTARLGIRGLSTGLQWARNTGPGRDAMFDVIQPQGHVTGDVVSIHRNSVDP
jgi:hypothetical protein